MTPKDVNEKRNTSAAAAASAGRSSGSVTARSRATGPAPSVAASSQRRGSSRPHQAPTTRTTTATLKKTCAARIAATPRSCPAGSSEERGRDDDRRKHEGHEDERAHERAAREVEPREDPGERQPEQQCQRRRDGGLPDREPEQRQVAPRRARRSEPAAPARARGSSRADRRRRAHATEARPAARAPLAASAQHDLRPLADPAVAVARRSPPAGSSSGCSGTTRSAANDGRQREPSRTGKTNIESGTSRWKAGESMKSISCPRPSSFRAPRRTPASSTCRKQLGATTAVGARVERRPREDDLGGRARGVGDDDRPVALAAGGAREARVYASSQPSTTSTPFSRRSRQKSGQPPRRTAAIVASRKARPGVDVAGFSTTSRSR